MAKGNSISGTPIGNLTQGGNVASLFDGVTVAYDYQAPWCAMLSAASGVPYGGLTADSAIYSVECWPSASDGYVQVSPTPVTVTLELYGKQGAAPANATDGTLLGSYGPFTDATNAHVEIASSDTATVWNHSWVRLTWTDGLSHSVSVAELQFFAPAGAALVDLILSSDVIDSGLAELADATLLHICSQQPTSYAEVGTYTLGSGSVTVGAPGAVTGGRKVTVPEVADTASASGDAVAWALVDASRLLATGKVSELVTITDGASFTLATFDIKIPVS